MIPFSDEELEAEPTLGSFKTPQEAQLEEEAFKAKIVKAQADAVHA